MRLFWTLFFITIFSPVLANQDLAQQHFAKGAEAFRNQDFSLAEKYFLQARTAGIDTPALSYNLGVSYYRLGSYAEADHEFEKLSAIQGWRGLASYNRGLVAERQEQPRKAKSHYQNAARYGDDRVKALSRNALVRLGEERLAHYVYASLSTGNDSNVTLQSTEQGSGEQDSYLDLLLLGRYYLNAFWSLQGLYYQRHYSDLDHLNTSLLQGGAFYQHGWREWRWEAGVGAGQQRLDGDDYLDSLDLELSAARRLRGYRLRFKGDVTRFSAASDFSYLEGWRTRLESRARKPFSWGYLQVDHRLELNDRDDWEQQERFLSFSPTRHRLRLTAQRNITNKLTARGTLEYEHSYYADHFFINGDHQQRTDQRMVGRLRLAYEMGHGFSAFALLAHTNNSSSLDVYDYKKKDYALGLEYGFF